MWQIHDAERVSKAHSYPGGPTRSTISYPVKKERLKGYSSFERAIKRLRTKTTIEKVWRWHQHINQLELEALLVSVRHMASCSNAHGHRSVSLIDNTSALGVVTKGRSSSWVMNKVC